MFEKEREFVIQFYFKLTLILKKKREFEHAAFSFGDSREPINYAFNVQKTMAGTVRVYIHIFDVGRWIQLDSLIQQHLLNQFNLQPSMPTPPLPPELTSHLSFSSKVPNYALTLRCTLTTEGAIESFTAHPCVLPPIKLISLSSASEILASSKSEIEKNNLKEVKNCLDMALQLRYLRFRGRHLTTTQDQAGKWVTGPLVLNHELPEYKVDPFEVQVLAEELILFATKNMLALLDKNKIEIQLINKVLPFDLLRKSNWLILSQAMRKLVAKEHYPSFEYDLFWCLRNAHLKRSFFKNMDEEATHLRLFKAWLTEKVKALGKEVLGEVKKQKYFRIFPF